MTRKAVFGLVGFLLVACQGTITDSSLGAPSEGGPAGGGPAGVPGSARTDGSGTPGVVDNSSGPPTELVYVAPEDALDIPPEDFEAIPPDALIKASRDDCTSPCAVFFDAIADLSWDEIGTAKFTWVFSDGGSADGFMAARVFELPEGEAETTFEATLVVERDGFLVARDTHTVTVRPMSGRTICVAQSDFSGCPSGTSSDHFTDVDEAWDAIETDGRILFRRGDSFSPGTRLGSTVSGPVQVGAFGDPGDARPLIHQPGGSFGLDSGWSLTDLAISGGGMSSNLIGIGGHHTLVLRSHLHDAEEAFLSNGEGYDFSTNKFLMHNVVTGMSGTNYIGGDYIAIVGNHLERWGKDHHTIRLAGGNHTVIAGNALISDVGHSALTVRGSGSGKRPGSDYVLVQGNLMMQTSSVNPQNDGSEEWLRHVIWERNIHVPHESQTSIQDGINVKAQDMVIRNNVFYQIRRAILLQTHPLVGPSRNIHVYQNTHFVDEDLDSTQYFCKASSGVTDAWVENNLASIYGRTSSVDFTTGPLTASTNYVYTPARTDLCEEPNGSSTCTNPNLANTTNRTSASFMMPQAGSLAVDAAVDAPVSVDLYGTPRPQGDAPDVGAVERAQ